jgi:hypothetical protein
MRKPTWAPPHRHSFYARTYYFSDQTPIPRFRVSIHPALVGYRHPQVSGTICTARATNTQEGDHPTASFPHLIVCSYVSYHIGLPSVLGKDLGLYSRKACSKAPTESSASHSAAEFNLLGLAPC